MSPRPPADAAALVGEAHGALARREARRALDLLDAAIAAKQPDAAVLLLKARAHGLLGESALSGQAIDEALARTPNDLAALLAKADWLAAAGDPRAAASFYSAALRHMPRYQTLPPPLQEGLRRAQAETQRLVRELEDFVRSTLAQSGVKTDAAPARFRDAIDIMFGKKRPYQQEPRYLYYPGLPQIQFYERDQFPWLDRVEAGFEDVRRELGAVLDGDFKPYVTQQAGRASKGQLGMAGNPDWSAYFLRRDGAEQPGAARCPRTLAALADAPLTQIPKRAPSVLFSKLAPGAQIPPHTGMLNARLICHLPLIAPSGCSFRVGNDVRDWQEGKAWVFDDTIEHEAWNRSSQARYILIFDIWRPELSAEERHAVAALCGAIDAFGGAAAWDA